MEQIKIYKNGISTRQIILSACRELFLTKGYNETGYDDICERAHVNRGSVYYHFKQKENIRYEVFWELCIEKKREAEQILPAGPACYLFALYLIWRRFLEDEPYRKFAVAYVRDYLCYTPGNGLYYFFQTQYRAIFQTLKPIEEQDKFSLACAYGYLASTMLLIGENPEKYRDSAYFMTIFAHYTGFLDLPETEKEALLAEAERGIQAYQEREKAYQKQVQEEKQE